MFVDDNHPMGETRYGNSEAVSTVDNTSSSGSFIAPSDVSTPFAVSVSSVSESYAYPEQVELELTTAEPIDATT